MLPGRTIGMIFHKPSTRTRVGFEVGIAELGGMALYLPAADLQLARGESYRDTALVLSRFVSALLIRTFDQAEVDTFAEHASIPVINGLTDLAHPLQALADAMTIREQLGGLDGVKHHVPRRRQQRLPLADATGSPVRDALHGSLPGRLRAVAGGRRGCPGGRRAERRLGQRHDRPARGRRRRRRALHRRMDEHGPGGTSASSGSSTWSDSASTASCCPSRNAAPSRCIACRPTSARRSPRTCCTGRARSSGIRPRTASTPRRRSWRW